MEREEKNISIKNGLTAAEVLKSRAEHGENVLTPPKRLSLWRLYLEKYEDPIIRILLVAAVISMGLAVFSGEYVETIGIILAVLFATTVGFYFERDAAKKFDVLTALGEEQPVKVVRDGRPQQIARREVVVGDVVLVETGDEIPADGILAEATDLQVDESSLTGEQLTTKGPLQTSLIPMEKGLEGASAEAYPKDMLLRSSMVMNGSGRMTVTAVGDETEIGRVARQATEQTSVKTPLNMQLDRLAKLISKVGTSVSVLAFVLFLGHDVLTQPLWHTDNYLEMVTVVMRYFMMAVTLIVMAVPEGLPMAVTLALALNMRRMLQSNNLVRKLSASETMGRRRQRHWQSHGDGAAELAEGAWGGLCGNSRKSGNKDAPAVLDRTEVHGYGGQRRAVRERCTRDSAFHVRDDKGAGGGNHECADQLPAAGYAHAGLCLQARGEHRRPALG